MKRIVALLLFLPAAAAAQEEAPSFDRQAALFAQQCSKCHTVGRGDRVGPDLKGVTKRRDREWLVGFIRRPSVYLDSDPVAKGLLEKYNGVRMTDLGLSREQVVSLLEYVDAIGEGGGAQADLGTPLPERDLAWEAKGPDEGGSAFAPGLIAGGVVLCLAAGLWFLKWTTPAQVLVVVSLALGFWSLGGRRSYSLPGNHQGYAPAQPIAFSHRLHAGEMRISCLYCHPSAERGPVASVPAASICMNCHAVVKNVAGKEGVSPELAKLFAAWETRDGAEPRSVPWVRIHRLPDFVVFSHEAHVRNGLECQTCHGPVQTMDQVRQAGDLSMGSCVNCHRHEGREPPTHWKRAEGTLDCSACHQ